MGAEVFICEWKLDSERKRFNAQSAPKPAFEDKPPGQGQIESFHPHHEGITVVMKSGDAYSVCKEFGLSPGMRCDHLNGGGGDGRGIQYSKKVDHASASNAKAILVDKSGEVTVVGRMYHNQAVHPTEIQTPASHFSVGFHHAIVVDALGKLNGYVIEDGKYGSSDGHAALVGFSQQETVFCQPEGKDEKPKEECLRVTRYILLDTPWAEGAEVEHLSCGTSHTVVALANGQVWASGFKLKQRFSRAYGFSGEQRAGWTQMALPGVNKVYHLSAGDEDRTIVATDGGVWTWGRDKVENSSHWSESGWSHTYRPVAFHASALDGKEVVAVQAGRDCHVATAATADGGVYLWGIGKADVSFKESVLQPQLAVQCDTLGAVKSAGTIGRALVIWAPGATAGSFTTNPKP
mmetsp:Transcript_1244/g.5068  ORF Transcript_1244/g.5068 Transcript_1244/m.5068 type:complete len:406 (-) Transcript_1244:307-1524(-)